MDRGGDDGLGGGADEAADLAADLRGRGKNASRTTVNAAFLVEASADARRAASAAAARFASRDAAILRWQSGQVRACSACAATASPSRRKSSQSVSGRDGDAAHAVGGNVVGGVGGGNVGGGNVGGGV